MLNLTDREWKPFFLTELFPIIQRGKRLKSEKHIPGKMPYVSSSALNNGVDAFISNTDGVRIFGQCISLANSGSVGSSFYEPFSFVASDHITHLKNPEFNKYHYLFIASILNRLSQKYNFNREINDNRISREKIMLPIDDAGNIDLNFMEKFVQEREEQLIQKYIKLIGNINQNGGGIPDLKFVRWKIFCLKDMFNIYTGSDLIMGQVIEGTWPIVSHAATNNGIACRTEPINNRKLFSHKNTISLADRGNFKAFVQKEDFYIGTRVKALESKYKIPYLSLFFIANQINLQSVRFSYGHNACDNVDKIKILLPVNESNKPDYEFMEQYGKRLMIQQYQRYLNYLHSSRNL